MTWSPTNKTTALSVATGCMNRASSLRQTLPSWLACPEVDEVVVVDWSSQVPIHQELHDLNDPRILHVRVEGQAHWCAARCHNVEIHASSSEALLRIDSDIRLRPEFFSKHPLQPNIFWNAEWKNSGKIPGNNGDDVHLNGTIYTRRANFLRVNGYNEWLRSYGYEDDDLYNRLLAAGIVRAHIRRDLLEHLPHDVASRLVHIDRNFLTSGLPIDGIALNLKIAQEHPWTPADHLALWNVEHVNDKFWIYTQKT